MRAQVKSHSPISFMMMTSAGLCPSTEAKNLENRLIFKAKLPFLHVVGFAPMSINPCTLQKQA
jgi:hypothetical protein